MKNKIIPFLIVLVLLLLCSACSESGKETGTDPATDLPDPSRITAADRSTAENGTVPESAQAEESFPAFLSLTLRSSAGGPPFPGEDRSYSIKIKKDGPDYIGSLSKYGNMRARRLNEEDLLKIEQLLEEEKVADWNGFDIHETGLYDGYSISFVIEYRDGSRVSGSGYGQSPNNYNLVKTKLENILSPEEVYSDIILSLENGPILPAGTEVLKLKIFNNSSETVSFDRFFRLYRKQEEEWTLLPWKDDANVKEDRIELKETSAEVFSADLLDLLGSALSAGEYRIEWNVSAGGQEKIILAEFLATEEN